MSTSINILGMCVSRDTFGTFPDDGGFDIKKCVTNVNLASTCSPQLSKQDICSENDFPNSARFFRDVLHLT